MVIFAVGQKDAEERFPNENVDEKTGLDMRVRGEPGSQKYLSNDKYIKATSSTTNERERLHTRCSKCW